MKRLLPFIFIFISVAVSAQSTVNNYKIVIVPEKFSFLKEANQYKLNTLAKNLTADKGFTAYLDNADLPTAIATDKCQALNLDIVERNTMFSTNLTVVLKDCKGNVVFKSKEGKSREKDYDVAFNLALRDAFKSLEAQSGVSVTAVNTVKTDAATVTTNNAPAVSTTDNVPAVGTVDNTAMLLYAQPTATGYQLIDTTPKIRITLFKTSMADCYIAQDDSAQGIVYKRGNSWYFDYYQNNKLNSKSLEIKF